MGGPECPHKSLREEYEDNVEAEANIGVIWPQAKECWHWRLQQPAPAGSSHFALEDGSGLQNARANFSRFKLWSSLGNTEAGARMPIHLMHKQRPGMFVVHVLPMGSLVDAQSGS